jgi:voltage-gated potassium channel
MIKPSEQALNDFEEAVKWPMLALSVAIIPLLAIPLVMQLSETQRTAFTVVDVVIWVLFAAEYFVRLYLAPRKRHFMAHNILDLALVVVPFLRPLRAMRALRALRLLRLATALLFVARGIKASRRALMRHGLVYVLLVAALVMVAGVIVIRDVEAGHPESKIDSWGAATWWTFETVATAGSETPWPSSSEGQIVRVVLVLSGLALFGLITASLASWFVEVEEEKHDKARHHELEERLDRLQATLDALLAERAEHSAPVKQTAPPIENATKA